MLVSEPFMTDKNFQRTVVLLVEHEDSGSVGFVMNRQLVLKIHEVVEEMPTLDAPVFMGGPVEQTTLHYIHQLGDKLVGARQIFDGVYWGGSFSQLIELVQRGEVKSDEILFFVGYSGWGEGQLAAEIKQKSWIVAPRNKDLLFQPDYHDLWRQVLKGMGMKYRIIANYPIDPSLN